MGPLKNTIIPKGGLKVIPEATELEACSRFEVFTLILNRLRGKSFLAQIQFTYTTCSLNFKPTHCCNNED